jgi:hypothetical protein
LPAKARSASLLKPKQHLTITTCVNDVRFEANLNGAKKL